MPWYRVEGMFFVAAVEADESGLIIRTAPILHTFLGQPLTNLRRWVKTLSIQEMLDPNYEPELWETQGKKDPWIA